MNLVELSPLDQRLGAGSVPLSSPTPAIPAANIRVPIIKQYFSVLMRRKWVVLSALLVAFLAGLLITLLMTPQYTATNTIEIQRETKNFAMVEGAENSEASAIDQEFYQTQYGLLASESLAQRVATELRLYDNPAFFEMFEDDLADAWFTDAGRANNAATRAERTRAAGEILLREIEINPQRLSALVDISFTSPDPNLSMRVANAWSANFISATFDRRFEATSYARKFLEERLAQLRTRLEASERQLVTYAAQQGIINLPGATGAGPGQGGERSLTADDLVNLNQELSAAVAARIQAQSRLGAAGGSVNEGLQNPAITTMRGRRAELSAQYADLMARFQPNYPPARALRSQITELDRAITREESRVSDTLQSSYRAALTREQALTSRVNELKSGMLDLRRRTIQYNIHQRDADTNRQLYEALLQRYKEIGVAGGIGINNILVVDQAALPQGPSSPILWLNMILALFAGATIGIGLAFALEQIDEGIGDPSEVEQRLGVPLLGTVPRATAENPLDDLKDRKSPISEAYLSLQTRLAFSTEHGVPKTMAVTSTGPAEGKTTSSFALARSITRSGKRVLLVDGDMRSPSVHQRLGIENARGLSNYLSGDDDLERLISDYEGLSVMTTGPQPPNAAELLSSGRFDALLSEAGKYFDHVIVDAPPVMGLADAPLIGSRVEATVFVVESHRTKKGKASVALARMRDARSHIIGVVMTKFDIKRAHYGYGYDYGYGYGSSAAKPDPA